MSKTDYMYQEKKEEEDLQACKIAWANQYEDFIKRNKERLITAASNCTDSIKANRTPKTTKKKWEKTTV